MVWWAWWNHFLKNSETWLTWSFTSFSLGLSWRALLVQVGARHDVVHYLHHGAYWKACRESTWGTAVGIGPGRPASPDIVHLLLRLSIKRRAGLAISAWVQSFLHLSEAHRPFLQSQVNDQLQACACTDLVQMLPMLVRFFHCGPARVPNASEWCRESIESGWRVGDTRTLLEVH